jgi:transcriptional antiterminator RfaH
MWSLMTVDSSDCAKREEPVWFCLKAQPKREHLVASGLRKQFGIVCFAPRLRLRKLTRRGPVWFVEAMFPGYFFAQFDHVTERRRVEHAAGVRGLVQFGDRLATIDSTIIDALRQRMEADELVTLNPEIKVGQEVQIAHGPLQGLEVLVTQLLPASERVRVLLEFLGRSLQMEVSRETLIQPRASAVSSLQ